MKGAEYHTVLQEFGNAMRSMRKHESDEYPWYPTCEKIFEKFYEIVNEYGVEL